MPGLAQQAAGKPPRGPQYQAQQMLNPVIAALTRAAMGRARRSEAAISGFTDSYANQLGQLHSAAPYANAEAGQASIDAALQQSLAGHGSDLAAQLAQRLSGLQGSSGAGALAQESGQLASQGQSAGNTRLASGSASLSDLLANAANAGSYDQKLPGLAKLSGLQGIRQAEGNAQQAIDQGTLSVESQLPSLIHSSQVLQSENRYRNAQIQMGYRRLQIEQQNANTAAQRAIQTALSQDWSYGLALSRLGIEDKRLQLSIAKQYIAGRNGGLSASAVSRYKALAESWAQRTVGTYTNPTTGKVEPAMNFKDAMTAALKQGVPFQIAFSTFVKTYQPNPGELAQLDKYYGPIDKKLAQSYRSYQQSVKSYAQSAKTGPYGPAGPSDGMGGFLPLGFTAKYGRHDQGRDIQTKVGAPIIAPGAGYVVRIGSDPGGAGGHFGPSYPIVYFTSGPYRGRYVYIGHTVAAVHAGQRFGAGTVLSHTQRSGALNGGAPDGWAEIGYAPGGTPGATGQPAPF